jgi:phage shock protein A
MSNPVFATAIAALQNAEKETAAAEAHYQAVLNSTKGAQLHLDALRQQIADASAKLAYVTGHVA